MLLVIKLHGGDKSGCEETKSCRWDTEYDVNVNVQLKNCAYLTLLVAHSARYLSWLVSP